MDNLILSITTIGDLLLENRITRDKNGEYIDNVALTIPDYQRPYKWTARNAIQLLDDITEALNNNKEVYRVGTLILHKEVDKDGNTVYNIVDGQQRTITFSLLLHSLYELEDVGSRRPISFLNQKMSPNQFSRHNIPKNLNAFRRRISKSAASHDFHDHLREMKRLRDFIVSQCELIVVITDNQSEAFQFFDSQNARGKALFPHDLLKAYHLREMADLDSDQTEKIVRDWENIPQWELASFFNEYIYRIKEWINGNWATELCEGNIYKFKGITRASNTPYAQFYKSAHAYASLVNSSAMPFVSGTREINAFQLNAPIIAGKPFFDFTKHYFGILKDIRNNNKYEGFFIKGDKIVETLDHHFNKGVGNGIARLLFDTALLLYVDRFCPATFPGKVDIELFNQFVIQAFVWAYSLRAQYEKLGWQSAQNYILEKESTKKNSLNIYKLITESDSPASLLSTLADKLNPLTNGDLPKKFRNGLEPSLSNIPQDHYLNYFKDNQYYV